MAALRCARIRLRISKQLLSFGAVSSPDWAHRPRKESLLCMSSCSLTALPMDADLPALLVT